MFGEGNGTPLQYSCPENSMDGGAWWATVHGVEKSPDLSASLGIFIPLIVVNCIILGRAEAFASKNGVLDSLADGLGSGVGFTLSLSLIAAVREIVGAGTLTVWGDIAVKGLNPGPVTLAILPAGGFITLGLLLALINRIGEWNARRHGAPAPLPVNLDCRHCTMCGKGKEAVEKLKG